MTCPHCGTAGVGAPFCTACGADVREAPSRVATQAPPPTSDPMPRLVACPACGAPNAASRRACGRCREPFDDGADREDTAEQPIQPEPAARENPSGLLVLATVLAVLAGLAVLVAILSARGIGPLATDSGDVLGNAEVAEIVSVRASSERRPSDEPAHSAEHVVDGSASTAWVAEDGGQPWVELELAEAAEVTGIVLWNGNQGDDAFSRHDRVAQLRIETDERSFTVDLLDARGPLAIDLPEPVPASRLRLVAEEVFSGDEIAGAALSRVVVRVRPEG